MGGVVAHAGHVLDDQRDALQRPQLAGKSAGDRATLQRLLDLGERLVGQAWAGPVGPLLRSAPGPRALQRPCQVLTAWRETPSWRATSAWRMPAATARPRGAGAARVGRDGVGPGGGGVWWPTGTSCAFRSRYRRILRDQTSRSTRPTPCPPNTQDPLELFAVAMTRENAFHSRRRSLALQLASAFRVSSVVTYA